MTYQPRLKSRGAEHLQALLVSLAQRGLHQGAIAVLSEIRATVSVAQILNRDRAIFDLLAFIDSKDWYQLQNSRTAALVIESLAAAPVAKETAAALAQKEENLLSLRLSAEHYSLIFLQRKPLTGEPFNASLSSEGLISVSEKNALTAIANAAAKPNMKIAEVGVFSGWGSTRILAETARRNGGFVVCVDNFPDIGDFTNLRDVFEHSTTALGFRNLLKVIDGDSSATAALFPDGYFDLVYIDAGHGFEDANRDIKAWRPKVAPGGMMCGHDCIRSATEFSPEQLMAVMAGDSAVPRYVDDPRDPSGHSGPKVYAHPGVIAAVYENFGGDVRTEAGPCGIWSHQEDTP